VKIILREDFFISHAKRLAHNLFSSFSGACTLVGAQKARANKWVRPHK
jgi:hypothetical protein